METQDGSGEESREKRGKRGEGFLRGSGEFYF